MGLFLYPVRPYLPLFLSPYGMRPRLFSYNLSPAQTQPAQAEGEEGTPGLGSSQGSWVCPEPAAPTVQLPNQEVR